MKIKAEKTNRLAAELAAPNGAPAQELRITPPKMETICLRLIGTTPLCQNRFGNKARAMIQETQEAGSQAKKGRKRDPKNFEECYQQARHISTDGWDGIHCGGFRAAMVDACVLCGFFKTRAKLGFRIIADGYTSDGTPLTLITKGEPRMVIEPARNASGVIDLRARPLWDPGWECNLRVSYDVDMFSATDIVNLLCRVGAQCGICEGRPNSKASTGCDRGLFRIEGGPTE